MRSTNIWLEVSKTMVNNKYRFPLSKDDTAIYLVDIPKTIEILKNNFNISPKNNYMKFIKNNYIWLLIIVGLLISFLTVDSCRRSQFSVQQKKLDSTTIALQTTVFEKNKLGQEVARQIAIVTNNQSELKDKTAEIFQLKDKDQKQIKRINALVKVSTKVDIGEPIQVPYLDTLAMHRFSDSLERVCGDVIAYYDSIFSSSRKVEYSDPTLSIAGKVNNKGFQLDSLNLPNTMTLAFEELKGGLFRRDINGKVKFWLPKRLSVSVINSNNRLKINNLSSIIYTPSRKERWLERALILGAGIYLGTRLNL